MITSALLLFLLNGSSAHAAEDSGTKCVIVGKLATIDKRAHGAVLITLADPIPESTDEVCKTIDVNTILSVMRIPNPKFKVGDKIRLNLACPTPTICALSSVLPVPKPKPPPKDEKTKCLETDGGEWKSWTKAEASKNIQSCRVRAKDAGDPCYDDKDCSLHRCEYDPQAETGICSEFGSSEGCHVWMKDGQPQPKVCVD